jgi:hypothetical protein
MWQVAAVPCPPLKSDLAGSHAMSPAATIRGALATTEVGLEEALAEPTLLDAVTVTCTVEPTSALTNVYELPDAPEMSVQPLPSLAHRCH